jgi:hypothetical protein
LPPGNWGLFYAKKVISSYLISYVIGGDFLLAYKAIKAQRAREKALRRLIGKDPDYGVIQALINEARTDVVAILRFPNGTALELKRADDFDRFKMPVLDPERAKAY